MATAIRLKKRQPSGRIAGRLGHTQHTTRTLTTTAATRTPAAAGEVEMAKTTPAAGAKRPAEGCTDPSPRALAGQNAVSAGPRTEQRAASAYEVKDLHRRLRDAFSDEELKRIPVLPNGARLEQGATYIDLRQADARQFTARTDQMAGPGNWYVLKRSVGYDIWNRLLDVVAAAAGRR